jgi:Putative metallopeptidase
MGHAKVPAMPPRGVSPPRSPWWRVVLSLALTFGAGPVFSQPVSPPSSAPSQTPAPPESPASPGKFQARIDAAAVALRENNPRFKGVSLKYVQGLAEFVSGNMLFVLLHEMAHVSITQMGLPVLGRMEDAADTYATLRLIRSGSNFSHRVLTEAAQGWFMADRRDQKAGDKVAYYDDHGLNQQRASDRVPDGRFR